MLMRSPLARERRRPSGFIVPCQPTLSAKPPSGSQWLHEIKHDGYRIIACKSGDQVRLWSRNGRDWSKKFLAVIDALRALKADDIVLDGEAMAHCPDGLPDFHRLRSEAGGAAACLFAFDLLRLNGEDLRALPLEERRARLRKALRDSDEALRFSEHLEGDGQAIFRHACYLGLEGIVSKRRDARYRSGRSLTWRKIKNADYERR
jgi:bifunctional non-homologous end joining protein LigD